MTISRILLFPAIFLLFLAACQSTTGPITRPEVTIDTIPAEQSGNFTEAAEQYLQLGANARPEKQAVYTLRAASLYYRANQKDKSRAVLNSVNFNLLSTAQQIEATTLDAKLAIAYEDADTALKAISSLNLSNVSGDDRLTLLQLQAAAYGLKQNWLEQVNSYLQIDRLLLDGEALSQNRQALWSSLMQLTPQALDMFIPGTPPDQDSGWFALAYALKAYHDNPQAKEVALENWQFSYPNHPADPSSFQHLSIAAGYPHGSISSSSSLPDHIPDIAVLLPVTGQFINAAAAIQEGILAAHELSGSAARLHFIDVRTDSQSGQSNVLEAYNNAISLGASIVIGPLEKQAVEILAKATDLPIPVLALNRIDANLSRPNLYQFGLAPEDEAAAVAKYGEQHGLTRAAILSPQNEWGDRIANAFTDKLRGVGGSVVHHARYQESENDFRDILIPLLGVDENSQRSQSLRNTTDRSTSVEPRIRPDIDYIFLIARPLKARQLASQLRFHRSGQLPILATSHVYSGQINPQQDIDLDGLIIADISWMFSNFAKHDSIYQALEQREVRNFDSLLRLYAMGADAYQLLPELNRLSRDSTATYRGATGDLSINEQGHIERQLVLGIFKRGILQLTD